MRRTYVRRSSETMAATQQLVSFCDAIKIDCSFVREISKTSRSSRLMDRIAMMGKGMKFDLAAAGVEEKEPLDYLAQLGCDKVQGFFSVKPCRKNKFRPC